MYRLKKVSLISILLSASFNPSIQAFPSIKNKQDALNMPHGVIYLIGGRHDNEDYINQRKLLEDLGKKGKVISALEGEQGDIRSTLFGLEEKYTYNLCGAIMSLDSLLFHIVYKKIVGTYGSFYLNGKIQNAETYPTVFSVPSHDFKTHLGLISLYSRTAQRDLEEINFFLSQLEHNKLLQALQKGIPENYEGKNVFYDNFYDNIATHEEWYIVLNRVASYWLRQLNLADDAPLDPNLIDIEIKKRNDFYEAIKTTDTYLGLKNIAEDLLKNDQNIKKIAISFRDEIFLNKICSAYEKTKGLKKPFFVVVGANHIPFLKEQLSQKGYQVKVNDRSHQVLEELGLEL